MSAIDVFKSRAPSPNAPARAAVTVTPSDTTDLIVTAKALYLGQAGDVRLIPAAGEDADIVTLKNHPVGYVAVQTRRVLATGTTALHIVALFD